MSDLKLFLKKEKEQETLIHAVRIYSQDTGMEFGIEKCVMLVMKNSERHGTDRMELPNQDRVRTLGEKETFIYFCILEADTFKEMWMKEKLKKEYLRRNWKLLETKLGLKGLIWSGLCSFYRI